LEAKYIPINPTIFDTPSNMEWKPSAVIETELEK